MRFCAVCGGVWVSCWTESEPKLNRAPLASHEDILRLRRIMAGEVMDQGTAGHHRSIAERVGRCVPSPPDDMSELIFELLTWWNKEAAGLASPAGTTAANASRSQKHGSQQTLGGTPRITSGCDGFAEAADQNWQHVDQPRCSDAFCSKCPTTT